MIVSDLDQGGRWQTAVPDQFFTVGKQDHVIGPRMQNDGAGLHSPGHSPILPRRTEQHQLRRATVDVHRHGPAS